MSSLNCGYKSNNSIHVSCSANLVLTFFYIHNLVVKSIAWNFKSGLKLILSLPLPWLNLASLHPESIKKLTDLIHSISFRQEGGCQSLELWIHRLGEILENSIHLCSFLLVSAAIWLPLMDLVASVSDRESLLMGVPSCHRHRHPFSSWVLPV